MGIHLGFQNAKVKVHLFQREVGCLSFLCNLGTIRCHFKRVFGSVLFTVLFRLMYKGNKKPTSM